MLYQQLKMQFYVKRSPFRELAMVKILKTLQEANEYMSIDVLLAFRNKSKFPKFPNHFFIFPFTLNQCYG